MKSEYTVILQTRPPLGWEIFSYRVTAYNFGDATLQARRTLADYLQIADSHTPTIQLVALLPGHVAPCLLGHELDDDGEE